jgi:Fe-S cluster assembly iron-binding protein IscA
MLQVTQEATAVLKEARKECGAPPESGFRVRAEGAPDNTTVVQLSFQEDPEPTDQTIETPELRVFVAKELVEPLADRVLDVSGRHDGPRLTLR